MPTRYKIGFLIVVAVTTLILVVVYLLKRNVGVLSPAGLIATQERNLLFTGVLLSLILLIPVFSASVFIAWKYREGNPTADYKPDEQRGTFSQLIWWAIPSIVIATLGIIMWSAVHQLDPHKKIAASVPPMTIQVVALRWKWLFIYPKQKIATINFVQFPSETPITFELTADAPMNSFWIPQLGGQMYAMTGMKSELNLIAQKTGEFTGSAAEISGQGFASMRFIAKASSNQDFDNWVSTTKTSSKTLTTSVYKKLSDPSENNPVASYSHVEDNLYESILMKYTMPGMNY